MRVLKGTTFALLLMASGACYHATIETGLTPSLQKIEEPMATGWIYGLVPPTTVQTAARCPNGVAKVETYHSFLNWLVGSLTAGIFTPMTIIVTCAAQHAAVPGSTVNVGAGADTTAVRQALQEAAQQSAETHHEMYVVFQH